MCLVSVCVSFFVLLGVLLVKCCCVNFLFVCLFVGCFVFCWVFEFCGF